MLINKQFDLRLSIFYDAYFSRWFFKRKTPVQDKIFFELSIVEQDNVVRSAKDVDLANLEDAARKIALFEEKVINYGLPEANIRGMALCNEGKCLTMGSKPEQLLEAITEKVTEFTGRSVEGAWGSIFRHYTIAILLICQCRSFLGNDSRQCRKSSNLGIEIVPASPTLNSLGLSPQQIKR